MPETTMQANIFVREVTPVRSAFLAIKDRPESEDTYTIDIGPVALLGRADNLAKVLAEAIDKFNQAFSARTAQLAQLHATEQLELPTEIVPVGWDSVQA